MPFSLIRLLVYRRVERSWPTSLAFFSANLLPSRAHSGQLRRSTASSGQVCCRQPDTITGARGHFRTPDKQPVDTLEEKRRARKGTRVQAHVLSYFAAFPYDTKCCLPSICRLLPPAHSVSSPPTTSYSDQRAADKSFCPFVAKRAIHLRRPKERGF